MPQRVAVTGSSGLIGTALTQALRSRGDEVVELVRRTPEHSGQVQWSPQSGELDPAALDGVTAVVNLAGAGIGDKRWTDSYKQTLVDSRLDSTTTLVGALVKLDDPVRLVSGSAMGYYGDRGEEVVDEDSGPGTGFLADLVQAWEAATTPATAAGLPVAFARTGLVIAPGGGMMKRILPLAKLGLGGPLGNGRQWWAWITLADEVAALIYLLDHPDITGPVDLSTPNPVRQAGAMRALGRVLHRPALLPAPAFALHVVLGEMAGDVLASTRMMPDVLTEHGFTWQHAHITAAMEYAARA